MVTACKPGELLEKVTGCAVTSLVPVRSVRTGAFYSGSEVGQTVCFPSPIEGSWPRGADLLVSALLSPVTLAVCCMIIEEREKRGVRTLSLFLGELRSSPNTYHLVTSD